MSIKLALLILSLFQSKQHFYQADQGLLTFHKWLALQAKIEQVRHETKRIARLFLSFITQTEIILATTLSKNKALLCLQRKAQRGDQSVFCCYIVTNYSFRMTKFHISCLVSSKKQLAVANIDELSAVPHQINSVVLKKM